MELRIEKLIYGGDALARMWLPGDQQRGPGKAVFVPFVLPGERIAATVIEERQGFARARLDQVLEPSPLRATPPCPYFATCGGCHYQHTSYEAQLQHKAEILRETIRRTAKFDLDLEIQTHASPPLHYRNRTRFHTRGPRDFAIGYFRHGSRELLPVRECPISSPLINRALAQLWQAGEAGVFPPSANEIELFVDDRDQTLMVELYLRSSPVNREELVSFAQELAEAFPAVHGITALTRECSDQEKSRSVQMHPDLLFGAPHMEYQTVRATYRVSAGSFFQTNRHLTDKLVELVLDERRGRLALDLYSGVGLFAAPLAQRFERVVAVEAAEIAVSDLRHNVAANAKISAQSTGAYLGIAAGQIQAALVIVDPPRAGLGVAVCRQISATAAKEVVYVSCDPSTLARDLKQFLSDGWRITAMHFVDLFPQTFHIESITFLKR